ncbi:MAG: hypothetical protein LJF04_00705 [Gemmatimonadetes bacterium]|nr:hypothetical protein [Gemmatimonadota bacterium]
MEHDREDGMMKRFVGCAFVALIAAGSVPSVLRAQSSALDRGHFLVDGQASLVSGGSKGSDGRSTSFSLSPSVLYFVHPGIALGGSAQLGHTSGRGSTSSIYSLGPQAVVYFGDETASVRPFVRADVGIGRTKNSSTGASGSFTQQVNLTRVVASAGMLDLLTSSVGIHGEIFYRRDSYGGDADTWADQFGVGFGFSIFLGG